MSLVKDWNVRGKEIVFIGNVWGGEIGVGNKF